MLRKEKVCVHVSVVSVCMCLCVVSVSRKMDWGFSLLGKVVGSSLSAVKGLGVLSEKGCRHSPPGRSSPAGGNP